jgi:hypothetical protein
MGVMGLALEDLAFPPVLDTPPELIPLEGMLGKLQARTGSMTIVGRTDAPGSPGWRRRSPARATSRGWASTPCWPPASPIGTR